MRSITFFLSLLLLFHISREAKANEPDSVFVFAYTTNANNNTNGLHFAWTIDHQNWNAIGSEFSFLKSDYGQWGTQKKMINPSLVQDNNAVWHCFFTLNDQVGQLAHTTSYDLIHWTVQSYPVILNEGNIQDIEVTFDSNQEFFIISWKSILNNSTTFYKTSTADFKNYATPIIIKQEKYESYRESVVINGESHKGTIHKVPWRIIDQLTKYYEWYSFKENQHAEKTIDDSIRFAGLKDVKAEIKIDTSKSKPISNMLIGIFFEDISYAADGGLYAELIQNRDFEYQLGDKKGQDTTWNSKKAWAFSGNGSLIIDSLNPIHQNNKHFAVIKSNELNVVLSNKGYDGIAITNGEKYNLSLFAKSLTNNPLNLKIQLTDPTGQLIDETVIKGITGAWSKYEATLLSAKTVTNAQLQIIPLQKGDLALDFISLFPQNTFHGHKNGLRKDLAQAIADLHPRFVRFPGGCVAHGDGLDNMYHWSRTIGPVEARVPQRNIWNYHQTAGLGYFEYFQFCEDIGAEPIPVLPAAVPCQNSSVGGNGQQCGLPMSEMGTYIQEVLDLIEWANGDKNSEWGKLRAEAGHPKPFNLKYIGIGNEDLISDVFIERFTMIYNAVREKYPDITIIGTVGPFYYGADYDAGWNLATKLNIPMVDEHYYQSPGWFINNQDFYDKYDRSKSKVYLGEYASHLPGRPNNIETALSEALYLTAVERNADVVAMTSYAPLLAKEDHFNWTPDMIYFNNTNIHLTTDYYVQKLYGNNSGDTYIPSFINLSDNSDNVTKRLAMSFVKDSETDEWIIKLVNMLPVDVNANIDLNNIGITNNKAKLSVLTGKPDDKEAIPTDSEIDMSKNLKYSLPAYSFSVIRFK